MELTKNFEPAAVESKWYKHWLSQRYFNSNAPQEWNVMFGNIENNFAPWKFSPDDRDKWVEEMV